MPALVIDGVSTFSQGSCLPLSPLVSPCLPFGWCVRLPEGLVSPSLPLCPFLFPFVGWCVHLPEGLLSPFVSPCAPSCFPLLDVPLPLPEGLVSPCVPLSPLVSPCLTSYSPSSVLLGVLNAFLRCPPWCWMVCLPSRGSCLPLCQLLFPFVGWCVRLPEGLVSPCLPLSALLSPLVSNCTPFCFPLLDVPLPEGLVSPCLPLSPFLFPKQCTVRGS